MSKILLFSDLHLHEWSYAATVTDEGINSRLQLQIDVVKDMINKAEEEGVEHVIFCGDLFHKHGVISTPVLQAAGMIVNSLIDRFDQVYFMVGNHDMYNKSGSINALSWIRAADLICHPGEIESAVINAVPVSFIGYTTEQEKLKSLLSQVHDGYLFMHQGLLGVPVENGFIVKNEIMSTDMIPKNAYLYTGHYHHPLHIGTTATIIGAPMAHVRGDNGPRGFRIIELDSGFNKFYESKHPKFVDIDYKDLSTVTIGHDFIRVLNCEVDSHDVRKALLDNGAYSVEVLRKQSEKVAPTVTTPKVGSYMDVIEDYKKRAKVNARRAEVVHELMEGKYATPKIPGT